MSGVQRASSETKECPMSDPVCAAKVIEHVAYFYGPGFDAAALVEKSCGRYTRGQHKGQLRGWAAISRCVEGGWRRSDGRGYVLLPGTLESVVIADRFSGKTYLRVGAR